MSEAECRRGRLPEQRVFRARFHHVQLEGHRRGRLGPRKVLLADRGVNACLSRMTGQYSFIVVYLLVALECRLIRHQCIEIMATEKLAIPLCGGNSREQRS